MKAKRSQLNNFLSNCFNMLINAEEDIIQKLFNNSITVKEVHLIEKIGDGEKIGLNTAGDIAKALKVTLGTLTVTANTLIKKGLVTRLKTDVDKRIVRLTLTSYGNDIYKKHQAFHNKLAMDILKNMNDDEQKILVQAMETIEKYFFNKEGEKND